MNWPNFTTTAREFEINCSAVQCIGKNFFNVAIAIIFQKTNVDAGEPISSHAKGYEAIVHFGQPLSYSSA